MPSRLSKLTPRSSRSMRSFLVTGRTASRSIAASDSWLLMSVAPSSEIRKRRIAFPAPIENDLSSANRRVSSRAISSTKPATSRPSVRVAGLATGSAQYKYSSTSEPDRMSNRANRAGLLVSKEDLGPSCARAFSVATMAYRLSGVTVRASNARLCLTPWPGAGRYRGGISNALIGRPSTPNSRTNGGTPALA